MNRWSPKFHGWPVLPGYLPRCKISLRCDEGILSLHMQSFLSKLMFTRLVFGVLPTRYPEAVAPIFTLNTSNDVVSCKDVLFWGSQKQKLSHFFLRQSSLLPPTFIHEDRFHTNISILHITLGKNRIFSVCQKCSVTQNMPKCVFGWGSTRTPMGKLTTLS